MTDLIPASFQGAAIILIGVAVALLVKCQQILEHSNENSARMATILSDFKQTVTDLRIEVQELRDEVREIRDIQTSLRTPLGRHDPASAN